MRRVALVFTASVASACLFPSLDELTSGDAQVEDATFEASSDAPVDAKGNDASDAASDVQKADADAGPFCAQHPTATFCADFDESTDPAAGFSSTYLTDGGVVARDTTAYFTAPASLLAGDTTLATNASSHGAVTRSTGVTPTSGIAFDFDLRIDKLATQGSYIEALAIVINATVKSSLQLNLKATSSEVGEEVVGLDGGKTYTPHTFPTALAVGQWMHVSIVLALKSAPSVTVTIDSTLVVDHAPLTAAFSSAGTVDLFVGNAYSPGPSDGATIHYDDALLVVN